MAGSFRELGADVTGHGRAGAPIRSAALVASVVPFLAASDGAPAQSGPWLSSVCGLLSWAFDGEWFFGRCPLLALFGLCSPRFMIVMGFPAVIAENPITIMKARCGRLPSLTPPKDSQNIFCQPGFGAESVVPLF